MNQDNKVDVTVDGRNYTVTLRGDVLVKVVEHTIILGETVSIRRYHFKRNRMPQNQDNLYVKAHNAALMIMNQ